MERTLAHYLSLDYPYEITRDPGGEFFSAHPDLPGCMASGVSAEEAMANLDEARALWIETRLEGGYDIPEPIGGNYSGRVSLRMPISLHASLAKLARRENMSLNAVINHALAAHVGAVGVSAAVRQVAELKSLIVSAVRPFRAKNIISEPLSDKADFSNFARHPTGTGSGEEGPIWNA